MASHRFQHSRSIPRHLQGHNGPLPQVWVVGGRPQQWPVRERMHGAVESVRPAVLTAASVVFGLWPLVAVAALAIGLIWSAGVAGSP